MRRVPSLSAGATALAVRIAPRRESALGGYDDAFTNVGATDAEQDAPTMSSGAGCP